MYRYCSQVSAVDGVIVPFTSQTSTAYPRLFSTLYKTFKDCWKTWLSL